MSRDGCGTVKWGDSVNNGAYESGAIMLDMGLDGITKRIKRAGD